MILGRGCKTYKQVWTPHIIKQAQLGVPYSKIHVELARLITELNKCLRSRRWKPLYIPIEGIWSDVQTRMGTPHMKIYAFRLLFWGGDTAHYNCEVGLVGRWEGGCPGQIIMHLCCSILQAGTCKIFSLAENPRWSRVWQYGTLNTIQTKPHQTIPYQTKLSLAINEPNEPI